MANHGFQSSTRIFLDIRTCSWGMLCGFPRTRSSRHSFGLVPAASGVSGELTSVSAVNKTTAWAGGTDGLLKTTDGGATWKRQPLDFGTLTPCVYAVNSQVVWAAGGNVYRTTNGGATWEIVLQGTGSVHSFTLPIAVAATDSNTAWVRNLNCVNIWGPTYWCDIVKTEDGGTTWSLPQASGAMAMAGLWPLTIRRHGQRVLTTQITL